MDLGTLAKEAVCHVCVRKEDTSQETAGIKLARRVRKARNRRTPTTRIMEPGTIATKLVTMRGIVRRRKSQARQVSAVEVICTA